MARIVVFGATGFTGRLVAEALRRRGIEPLLAGRSQASLTSLSDELGGGCETAVADVTEPSSIGALLSRDDVLVTTVGPFLSLGEPALDAAIAAGAHYIDTTGEGGWVRRVVETRDAAARESGSLLLPAIGFDYVPGNLAGALALEAAGEAATRLDVGYFFTGDTRGGLSRGTIASAASIMSEPSFAFRDGELVTERIGARVRSYEVLDGKQTGMTFGSSEAVWLPRRFPHLRDLDVHQGGLGPVTRPASAMSRLTASRPVSRLLGSASRRLASRPLSGPDAERRSRSRIFIAAVASDAGGGELAKVELAGPNVYDFTGEVVAWAATETAGGNADAVGAAGPVEAFGLEALEAGCRELGLARTEPVPA